jgi:hypothetical protein
MSDLTFEEWILYVFDRPVEQPEWYWDINEDLIEEPPDKTVTYLTRLFEKADKIVAPYTDVQVNQGLWYIASSDCSNHMFTLLDEAVPWPDRQRCIRSMVTLFEGCFARRCTPTLSYLNEPGYSPINMICYMWFDVVPIYGRPDILERADVDREFLDVMEEILKINSDACRESALHGLGHWEAGYRGRVHNIVRRFLWHNPFLRSELRAYARKAWNGDVQ